MIVEYENYSDKKLVYIWLDEVLPPDFVRRVLTKLLMLAEPVGLGNFEAAARKGDLAAVLDEALAGALVDRRGRRNIDDAMRFDYVSGYRIKVEYLPFGFSIDEESPEMQMRHIGMPVILSSEFDQMYGDGALQGAVSLALRSGER